MKTYKPQYEIVAAGEYGGVEVAVMQHKHGYTIVVNVQTESEVQDDIDTVMFVRELEHHNRYVMQESIFINCDTITKALDVLARQTAGH